MLFRGAAVAMTAGALRAAPRLFCAGASSTAAVTASMTLPVAPRLVSAYKWETTVAAVAAAAATSDIPSTPGVPKIELYDLRDDPALGSLFRATFQEGDKVRNLQSRIILTVFPQLGPRKYDPSDPTPQFDIARRASIRLLPSEAGALCAVMEGRITEISMKNSGFSIHVARTHDGVVLKGEVFRDQGKTAVPFVATVAQGNLLSFFRFLESCITESFGFKYVSARQLFLAMRNQRRGGNGSQSNSNNNNGQQRGGGSAPQQQQQQQGGNTSTANNTRGGNFRRRYNNNNFRRRNNNYRRNNNRQGQQQQQQQAPAAATTTAAA